MGGYLVICLLFPQIGDDLQKEAASLYIRQKVLMRSQRRGAERVAGSVRAREWVVQKLAHRC